MEQIKIVAPPTPAPVDRSPRFRYNSAVQAARVLNAIAGDRDSRESRLLEAQVRPPLQRTAPDE